MEVQARRATGSTALFPPQRQHHARPGRQILAVAGQFVASIPVGQQTFADVSRSNPFWVYVERVAGQGLISGYTCGGPGEGCDGQHRPYFRSYTTATRGQISKMIYLTLAQP